MRLLVELLVIAAVVVTGWSETFSGRFQETRSLLHLDATPSGKTGADGSAQISQDRPAYNSNHTFTGHVMYKDEAGKEYWLDAQGHRHYEH